MEEYKTQFQNSLFLAKMKSFNNQNQYILTSHPFFGKNERTTSFNNKNKHILGFEHYFC